MEIGFRFEVKWSDADLLDIRISGWNGAFGGSTAVYVPIGGLKEAATKVEGFPRHPSDKSRNMVGLRKLNLHSSSCPLRRRL